jgi:hypothetical protein
VSLRAAAANADPQGTNPKARIRSQDSEGVMFLSPFIDRLHLAIWIALLVLVVIPAAVALRVWLRD